MPDIKKYEPLWGTWYIESLIGRGAFSKVYKVRREAFDKTHYSAVKIISIPQDESEIRLMRREGLDEDAMRRFFHSFAKSIISEIDLITQFRGHSHIVSIEDYQFFEEKTDTMGWDILIRMELLTSLSDYMENNPFSEKETIKLGVHMCRALELCALKGILHRDIKPDNIFISPYGDYKLGDFGIARQTEYTSAQLSIKGTNTYMAPEVSKNEPYGANADTYSLGIVMYSLLNQNRTPFLPDYPQSIVASDRENAQQRRMNGEPVPDLKGVSPELNRLVQKACAYNRNERFSSPAEMREALISIENALDTISLAKDRSSNQQYRLTMGNDAHKPDTFSHAGMPAPSADPFQTDEEKNWWESKQRPFPLLQNESFAGAMAEPKQEIDCETGFTEGVLTQAKKTIKSQTTESTDDSYIWIPDQPTQPSPLEQPVSASWIKRIPKPLWIGTASFAALAVILSAALVWHYFSLSEKPDPPSDPEQGTVFGFGFEPETEPETNQEIETDPENENDPESEADPGTSGSENTGPENTSGPETGSGSGTLQELRFKNQNITNNTLASMVKSGEIPPTVFSLNLSFNQITNISPLKSLTGLKYLNLGYNDPSINDFSPLTSLPGLLGLHLSGQTITDYSFLKSLKNLQELGLNQTKTNNLSLLSHLTGLTILSLNANNITDVSPLKSLTKLQTLNLEWNNIKDLTPLKSLKNLKNLSIVKNPSLTEAQIKDLQAALPNCTINYS